MTAFRITYLHQLIRFIKETKYTKRCSVKGSTIYTRPLFFIVARVTSKMVKIMCDQILTVWKNDMFFGTDEFVFSYFIFSSSDMFY
jgi:hypothetical protein